MRPQCRHGSQVVKETPINLCLKENERSISALLAESLGVNDAERLGWEREEEREEGKREGRKEGEEREGERGRGR